MVRIAISNYGKGVNRTVYQNEKIVATIHKHPLWRKQGLPDAWNVCWMTGRVDWHSSLAEARDNALKGL